MSRASGCQDCSEEGGLGFEISMASQPIVEVRSGEVFAYEALFRGADGTGAGSVLSRVPKDNRYTFDQTCRVRAIELAA